MLVFMMEENFLTALRRSIFPAPDADVLKPFTANIGVVEANL